MGPEASIIGQPGRLKTIPIIGRAFSLSHRAIFSSSAFPHLISLAPLTHFYYLSTPLVGLESIKLFSRSLEGWSCLICVSKWGVPQPWAVDHTSAIGCKQPGAQWMGEPAISLSVRTLLDCVKDLHSILKPHFPASKESSSSTKLGPVPNRLETTDLN